MSSSVGAGHAASVAVDIKKTKCKASKDKKHKWVVHRKNCPSQWEECSKCKATIYWK